VQRSLLLTEPENILIVTNADFRFYVEEQLNELNNSFGSTCPVVFEPAGRNTAPAVALAVKFLLEKIGVSEEEVLFIFPSDHVISANTEFAEWMGVAERVALEGYIVTFGIKPERPETGYGYIEASVDSSFLLSGGKVAYKVKKFHEKPACEVAKRYVGSGNYYWNSGMFAFTVRTILNEFEKHAPAIYERVKAKDYESFLVDFEDMPDISIDYAVMEKTDKAVLLPLNIKWSDVGSWDAVYELMEKDENKNVKVGDVVDMNTRNCLIFGDKKLISSVGVEDLLIVDTDDVLLIARRGQSQKVKELVRRLKKSNRFSHLTECHTTVYRPWGEYTELERGKGYKVKRIKVKPGGALSLQLHYHRSEHWVVVKGTAKILLEDENGRLKEYFVHENESIYVPKTKKHRIVNPGKVPLEIVEVQVGEYLSEDDIVRFDDEYGRN